MIKTAHMADEAFLKTITEARREFAGGETWSKEQQYGAMVMINREAMDDPNYLFYMVRRLLEHERSAIYQAVVNSDTEWTAIRSKFIPRIKEELIYGGLEYAVRVEAYASDKKVYVPVYEQTAMPRDVFRCSWCGGFTKNDKRGNCAACGAPRNDDYLRELEAGHAY